MIIEELGKEGEKQARLLLKKRGFYIGQSDWIGRKDNQWFRFEVKRKERFMPPPFEGHGLDVRQVEYAMQFQADTKIPTILLIWELGTNKWFWRRIDFLEKGEKFTTRNNIKIYKLSNFLEVEYEVDTNLDKGNI